MAPCDYCRVPIFFGGVRDRGFRFCNQKCYERGFELTRFRAYIDDVAARIPEENVWERALIIHQGDCPLCGGPGPVDVRTSHRVWSAVLYTRWQSRSQVCCGSCGVRTKLRDVAFSALLGWWGPCGGFATPIQIVRNLGGLMVSPDPMIPSARLESIVRLDLANESVAASSDFVEDSAESM
jgi:hypothetical protein